MAVPSRQLTQTLKMPVLGFGAGTAWLAAKGEKADSLKETFMAALDAGFRHIDDAEMYQNTAVVGEAIRAWLEKTKTPRSDVFVTSKVMNVDDPGCYEVCKQALEDSGLGYYDLYLIHAPFTSRPNEKTGLKRGDPYKISLLDAWRQMERLVDEGKAKAIGVSNWRIEDLQQIYDQARVKPCCNQVEAHPYLQQVSLKKWCEEHGIFMTSYAPQATLTKKELAGGPVDSLVGAAAKKYGKTEGQVLLRWNLQTGRGVMTTTTKVSSGRIQEALGVFSFELTQPEVDAISAAGDTNQRRAFWGDTPLKASL